MGYRVAIAGATGLVGRTMLEVLHEMNFPMDEVFLFASPDKEDREIKSHNNIFKVIPLIEQNIPRCDIALFSMGSGLSKLWADKFTKKGAFVIDNSSAFRMDEKIPLIVPEVNAHQLTDESKIIANPNCSTIQLVVALNEVHKQFGLEKIFVSTYQSVSGAGKKGIAEYKNQKDGSSDIEFFPKKIFGNAIPQIGDMLDNGYCTEELKMVNETRKIYNDYSIEVYPTVVRVPVEYSHAESVTFVTKENFTMDILIDCFNNTEGLHFSEDLITQLDTEGKNDVYVSRLRIPDSNMNIAQVWIVADNVRKGAATNAVQIADILIKKGLLK